MVEAFARQLEGQGTNYVTTSKNCCKLIFLRYSSSVWQYHGTFVSRNLHVDWNLRTARADIVPPCLEVALDFDTQTAVLDTHYIKVYKNWFLSDMVLEAMVLHRQLNEQTCYKDYEFRKFGNVSKMA